MKKRKPKLEPSVGTREKSSRKGKKRNSKSSRDKDKDQSKNHSIQQHEDVALKVAVGFFADELLPYFGIEGKVVGYAPTEVVHLEVKRFLQDFNLIMENGSWKHFEFQSKNEGTEGLRRYRSYEALISYQYKVPVTTYVLFSGGIRNPMTELREGVNTYRIVPIIMRDKNADQVISDLQQKVESCESLTREDLIPLSLCLLMGGAMPQKERVKSAFDITGKVDGISTEDIAKIEAMVFIMADKFLSQAEMEEIKEGIRVTKLGQMLVELGKEEGKEEEAQRYSRLIISLTNEGKEDVIIKVANDTKLREEMYREYQL